MGGTVGVQSVVVDLLSIKVIYNSSINKVKIGHYHPT